MAPPGRACLDDVLGDGESATRLPGAVRQRCSAPRHVMPSGLSLCACLGCRGTPSDLLEKTPGVLMASI